MLPSIIRRRTTTFSDSGMLSLSDNDERQQQQKRDNVPISPRSATSITNSISRNIALSSASPSPSSAVAHSARPLSSSSSGAAAANNKPLLTSSNNNRSAGNSGLTEAARLVQQQRLEQQQRKEELERCMPPRKPSLYTHSVIPSSSSRSIAVLCNQTLCRFGGLSTFMHLVHARVPATEGSLPSNYEIYSRACLEHRQQPIEELRQSLSVTPGRYTLAQLNLHCCAAFGDSGAKTVVSLIHHNRHALEDLQLQCSGLTDVGLATILEALTDREVPPATRDNLALALHDNVRMTKLMANGGHFAADESVVDGAGGQQQQQQQDEDKQKKKRAQQEEEEAVASPHSKGLQDVLKMERLRNAVQSIIDKSCPKLSRINLSCNTGITAKSTAVLCEFLHQHPRIRCFVNTQQTKLDQQKVRDVLQNNRSGGGVPAPPSIMMTNSSGSFFHLQREPSAAVFYSAARAEIRPQQQQHKRFAVVRPPASKQQQQQQQQSRQRRMSSTFGEVVPVTHRGKGSNSDDENDNDSLKDESDNSFNGKKRNAPPRQLQPGLLSQQQRRSTSPSAPSPRSSQASNYSLNQQQQQSQQRQLRPSSSSAALRQITAATASNLLLQQDGEQTQKPQAAGGATTASTSASATLSRKEFDEAVSCFESFMNPHSGMIELSRLADKHPHLVGKITKFILAERSKVEEQLYHKAMKQAQIQRGDFFFSRSKLPLAHVPELATELKAAAQHAAAQIDRTPNLSLDTVNFIVFLQAMHPTVPLIELERACCKYCEWAHTSSETRALTALEVPLSVTLEALEMFRVLDADCDGFVTLQDFERTATSREGKSAAKFMFDRFGLDKVSREAFIPLVVPYLVR